MKRKWPFCLLASFGCILASTGDDSVPTASPFSQPEAAEAEVVGEVDDGSSGGAVAPELPAIDPAEIVTSKILEAGNRRIVVQKVVPQSLAVMLPQALVQDSLESGGETLAGTSEVNAPAAEINVISATVYNHQHTLIRWSPDGTPESEMAGWTNVDFNHFLGFSSFSHGDRRFIPMVLVSNVPTDAPQQFVSVLPALQANGPAISVTHGNASNETAMAPVMRLFDLYDKDGSKLKLAYEGRVSAQTDREAALQANPPESQDIVVRHWRVGGKPVKQLSSQSE